MENIKQDQVVDVSGVLEVEESQVEETVEAKEEEQVMVAAEVRIQVLSNGGLAVNVPEGAPELNATQVENIVKSVYDQLHEQRIAQQALELFKSKLSF